MGLGGSWWELVGLGGTRSRLGGSHLGVVGLKNDAYQGLIRVK